jgi:antirestriction protein ArdC
MTRTERLREAHDRLVAAVEQLVTGVDWLSFLDTARTFRAYSLNNVLLIFAQRPDATRVAGYQAWRSLGRQVRRGEQGIAILVPCTYRHDSDTSDAEPEPGTRRVLRGFKVAHVFDVSQTDGDPLPEPPVRLLDGPESSGLTDRLAELVRAEQFDFVLGPMPSGHEQALGVTDYVSRTVTVRRNVSPAQQAKTTAHELAHVLLHGDGTRASREVCEVEAESVAYLVCGTNGLSTDAYSLGYVASWASGDLDTVRATAERVTACAARILDALDTQADGAA